MDVKMDCHDALGAWCDFTPDIRRIHLPGLRQRIHEYRRGARVCYGVDCGDVGQRGHDHLVAWPDAQCDQHQVQRDCTVAHADGILCAREGGKLVLELCDEAAFAGNPCRVQTFEDVAFLVAGKVRLVKRDFVSCHAAADGRAHATSNADLT